MRRVTHSTSPASPPEPRFFRSTLALPVELKPFVEKRKNDLQHAGNFSSYVRNLILDDERRQREGAREGVA